MSSSLRDGLLRGVENVYQQTVTVEELDRLVKELREPLVAIPDRELAHLLIQEVADGEFTVLVPIWTESGPSSWALLSRWRVNELYDVLDPVSGELVQVGPRRLAPEEAPAPDAYEAVARPPRALSDTPVPVQWRAALAELVHRLVIGDYAGLEADGLVEEGSGEGLDHGIGYWIEAYLDTLVDLPADAWEYTEHAPWEGRSNSWWVIVPLWTEHESPSDLSMEATVWDDGTEIRAQIDTAPHVM